MRTETKKSENLMLTLEMLMSYQIFVGHEHIKSFIRINNNNILNNLNLQ